MIEANWGKLEISEVFRLVGDGDRQSGVGKITFKPCQPLPTDSHGESSIAHHCPPLPTAAHQFNLMPRTSLQVWPPFIPLPTPASALCGYPHVKVSIRYLSQISTAAPIFQQFIYFRQNFEENVTFTFFLFSFASNFPCKIL